MSDNFSKCILAVPDTANDRTIYLALVRWNGSCLDDMYDVLPNSLVAWLSLRSFNAALRFSAGYLVVASWLVVDRFRNRICDTTGQFVTHR